MNKKNWFAKQCCLGVLTQIILSSACAAEQPNNAQQALQQLRILQQRLSQNQPNSQNPVLMGTPAPSPNPGVSETPNQNDQIPIPLADNVPKQAEVPQVVKVDPMQAPQVTQATEVVAINEAQVIDNKAYKDMEKSLFPMNSEQIVRLKQKNDTIEYAKASPAGTPPKPTATSQFVNLSPGSTPPVIRLAQGFVSSLVFLDSSGSPWPIAAYDLGDPNSFNIQWDKTSNTLMIQALKLYNYGNLAVRLKGLNTPVMLTLIPGQKAVDYRVDLRVQGYGPNAKSMPMEEGLPPSASEILLHVLDGVPPAGSKRLPITGGDARAWLVNDRMYIRTNLTILSPGWLGSMTSADGTHAYEMQKSPVLLVSWHGKVMQLKVEGL